MERENLGQKSGVIDANINNRIQEIEESQVLKIPYKTLTQQTKKIKNVFHTMRRPNLRIIGIEENEALQLKGPVNIFNKIIEGKRP